MITSQPPVAAFFRTPVGNALKATIALLANR
jgi:DNA-binding NarL/FixJ family response regulator